MLQATMKVCFCSVLAFAVFLLVVSAKDEDKPKEELKLENPETKTEEKQRESSPNAQEGNQKTSSRTSHNKEFPTNSSEKSTKTPISDEDRCTELIGKFVNGTFVGTKVEYDLQKLLEKYGGAPGKVNATWAEKDDAPVKKENLEKRPLPDADETHWLYKYGDTDGKTYIRIEHAVRRFSGTPKAFLEIRGELYFTPDDFCGKSRHAHYTVDDRGFTSEVTHEYCTIDELVSCASPARCTADEQGHITWCVAAPSNALLASLVGGGK